MDAPQPTAEADIPVVPVRHPGRWVAAVVVLVVAAMFVHWLIATKELHWHVVGHYMFDSAILAGVRRTIILTIVAMAVVSRNARAPASLLIPFRKEER